MTGEDYRAEIVAAHLFFRMLHRRFDGRFPCSHPRDVSASPIFAERLRKLGRERWLLEDHFLWIHLELVDIASHLVIGTHLKPPRNFGTILHLFGSHARWVRL